MTTLNKNTNTNSNFSNIRLFFRVLGLSLNAALNAPIPDTKFGIFRM